MVGGERGVVRQTPRAKFAAAWRDYLATLEQHRPRRTRAPHHGGRAVHRYLKACRNERYAMSLLPPGRFLMPGDLAGSPGAHVLAAAMARAAPEPDTPALPPGRSGR